LIMNKQLNQIYPQAFVNNKELNKREAEEGKLFLDSKPLILMVVLTTECNLDCIMCARANRKGLVLPFDKAKHLIKLFPYLEAIDWQGGEVFLVDYFKYLFLEAAKYPNIDQSIITNGLLINREWAEIFSRSRVNLTFSIDAVSEKTYEYIRRKARFEDLLAGLEIIKETNKLCRDQIQLHINAVVMRSNYQELYLFPKFCSRYGIKHLRFDFLRPDAAPEEDILLKPDYEGIKYLRRLLPEIETECKQSNIWFEYTFGPFLLLEEERPKPQKQNGSLKCKLPWKKIFIDTALEGAVYPDCLCEKRIGNIYSESIEEIWNSDKMQLYRKRLTDRQADGFCSKICLANAVDTYQLEGGNHK